MARRRLFNERVQIMCLIKNIKRDLFEQTLKAIILLFIMMIWPLTIAAAEDEDNGMKLWRDLNQTTDSILRYVKEGYLEEAQQLFHQFSEQFLSIRASDYDLSMKELQVITAVFDEAEEAVISVSLSHEDRINKVYKLRLLVDVYEATYEPLWKKTENTLMTPLKKMALAVEEENPTAFQAEYHQFIQHYEMVRPGWSVSLPDELYQQIDSQVKYLQQLRPDIQNKATITNHIHVMEEQLKAIYEGKQDEVSDPSLIWVIITIGGAIVLVLTYAGWKKYRGEKDRKAGAERVRRRIR
ncbi:sporulation protein YpjB [Evansella caseinilytica]|uniref:Sporulation protein YpjB n=1 Tax=Evansella caseinilytica TaxID=1503961 RepID=A0A1H3NGI0_9BACI|nr:sporulation protein YpjB [Evansella caseinilytica]SDY87843.1 sporulation protein YpjB [Evansella caseinilytica]